jgi:hypothetical protein
MAILKIKRLIEDLENSTTQVLSSSVAKATSAGYGGTAYLATSAGNAGSSSYASTSAIAGTAPYSGTAYRAYGTAGTILQ